LFSLLKLRAFEQTHKKGQREYIKAAEAAALAML